MRTSRSFPPAAVRGASVPALLAGAALVGVLGVELAPRTASAQVYGLPVVQSPFAGRPFAIALDGGTAPDGMRVGGLAIAAHRPAGRLVATLGAGRVQGFEAARTTYGGRLAFLLRFGQTGALAVAPFAGYGRVQGGDSANVGTGDPRRLGSLAIVPVGVGLGMRRAIAGRAVTVHVTPQAQWWRRGPAGVLPSQAAWYGRAAVGADVAVTPRIGVGLGYEAGGSSVAPTDGPRKRVLGLGLSYAPGRGRR